MSETSMRYSERGQMIVDEPGELRADLYNKLGVPTELADKETDALGRKMAAALELVEACGDDLAGLPLAVLLDDVAFVLSEFGQPGLSERCRAKAKQVRAALEKAGVKP